MFYNEYNEGKHYAIEKKIEANERYLGDHYPASLEKEEAAWHYSKEEAEKIVKTLGHEFKVTFIGF